MNEDLIYQLAIFYTKGVGFSIWKHLIDTYKSATNLFNNSSQIYENVSNVTYKKIILDIVNKTHLAKAEAILKANHNEEYRIISYYDENYPYRLKETYNPPAFLFIKGNDSILSNKRILSIVGTRSPSTYGKDVTTFLIDNLKDYDITFISGLAYGIDIIAHKKTLEYKIPNIGVIAGGLDKIYPSIHKPIAQQIIENNGILISENPLGVVPESYHFPSRNRIIAGCADAITVVEAGNNSGSLITAYYGNDANRNIFAVPGNINTTTSVGCNKLIKNNIAQVITNAEDIVIDMNWQKSINHSNVRENQNSNNNNSKIKSLDEESKHVFSIIKDNPKIFIDDLSNKVNIAISKLSVILLKLEIKKIIKTYPGYKYEINT